MSAPLRISVAEMQAHHIGPSLAFWRVTPGIGLSSADDPEELSRFLGVNQGLCFVAHSGDSELVGTVLCGHDGRRAYIYHLAVAEQWRRSGVARSLLRKVAIAARDRGVAKIHAMVFTNNPDGRSAWEALGWARRDDLVTYSLVLESE